MLTYSIQAFRSGRAGIRLLFVAQRIALGSLKNFSTEKIRFSLFLTFSFLLFFSNPYAIYYVTIML